MILRRISKSSSSSSFVNFWDYRNKRYLISKRRSRNGVATIVISLTQISLRVMGLGMEKNTNQNHGRKIHSISSESRAIVKAKNHPNYKHFWSDPISLNILQIREMWCKVNKNFRNRLQKRHLLEASTFEKVRISIFYIR